MLAVVRSWKCCSVDQAAETGQVAGDTEAPKLAWTELFGDHQAEFCPRDTFHLPPVEADVAGFRVAPVSQQRTTRGAAFPCHIGGWDRAGLAVFSVGSGDYKLSMQSTPNNNGVIVRCRRRQPPQLLLRRRAGAQSPQEAFWYSGRSCRIRCASSPA